MWMAAGAWDRTAAVMEFIAAHGGVKNADRAKFNPYRAREHNSKRWADLFAIGKAAVAAKQTRG